VIGAGPGGLSAAKRSAQYGASVAIAEQAQPGGGCVNRGCIPKKLMVYAAAFAHLNQDAIAYGWRGDERQFDWQRFVTARNQEIERLQQRQLEALTKAGVTFIHDRAYFVDAHTLAVGNRTITADKILLAVGGKPVTPELQGIEHALTSNDLFGLKALPQTIAILGGGYIGVESASILRGFGCEVILMNHEACILSGFDADLAAAVRQGLVDRGIQSLCSTSIRAIIPASEGFCLELEGDCPKILTVDVVLAATGREPQLDGLNLDKAGVKVDNIAIAVDAHSRTNQPHIFAIGDCASRLQLTPVARAEGEAFAETVYGKHSQVVNYDYVPSAVCSDPEAASVGLTEAKAREQYGAVRCDQTEFQPLFYSLTERSTKSLIKLVIDDSTDRILGVHMVGDHAAEIVQSLAVSLQMGVTKQILNQTIGIHPSSAEELFSLS
jgi:glutathione reductase (NADPH)